jgi:uncharacterized protein
MKSAFLPPKVEIRVSPIHGYGVFANKRFAPHELIEEAPGIELSAKENLNITIQDRVFSKTDDSFIFPLGYATLYNHANQPNATFDLDQKDNCISIVALTHITEGEEIFINYGEEYFPSRQTLPIDHMSKSNMSLLRTLSIFLAILLLSYFVSTAHHAAPSGQTGHFPLAELQHSKSLLHNLLKNKGNVLNTATVTVTNQSK